jgi:ATP-dependent helicase/nuclease subunit B
MIRRLFLGWDRPLLQSTAARLADEHASGTDLDLAGLVLALPGARAARRLKELLLEEAETRNLTLTPPRIVTLGQVAELLYESPRPPAGAVATRRLWSLSLQQVHRTGGLSPVFPHVPDDVVAWERLAGEVMRLHREVARGGRRFADVAEVIHADGDPGFDDHPRWRTLAEVERTYEAHLHSVGRSDVHLARIDALGQDLSLDMDLWLVGITEMPHVLRRMLTSVNGTVRSIIQAPEDEAESFDAFGCVRPAAWLERAIELPEHALRLVDRPGDQADAVLLEIAALDGAATTADVAVAVPDRELAPFLEQRLEEWDIPARFAEGTPVLRATTCTFLKAATEVVRSGARWDAFAALLRHPDVWSFLMRADGVGRGARAR